MAIYKGFSTKSFNRSNPTTIVGLQDNDFGPYTLNDKDLIMMDLLNAFNIRKGEKLMNPDYGCIIWEKLFDPMTHDIKTAIVNDVSRIVKGDPRISVLNTVTITETNSGQGLQISAEVIIKNTNELVNLNIAFDGNSNTASINASY